MNILFNKKFIFYKFFYIKSFLPTESKNCEYMSLVAIINLQL